MLQTLSEHATNTYAGYRPMEPLVFLPGLMCDARLFGPQIAALSPATPVMCAPITHGERVEEIASGLLDILPKRFALAGHSLGGMVAMEILRRAPDRISRLCLTSTHPLTETPQSAAEWEPKIVKLRSGRFDDVLSGELGIADLGNTPYRAEVLALYQDMATGLGPEAFIRQARALQRRRDQQATLRQCRVPTMIMCGADDLRYPKKRHEFMAELIPFAELKVIENAGHLPTLEQPDATIAALSEWMAMPLVLR